MTTRNYPMNCPCHICGLPIPDHVVNFQDRLYGTIDHVIPRADDGPDTPENRKPAHRYCNNTKGKRPLTQELQAVCKSRIAEEFSERPHMIPPNSKKHQRVIHEAISERFQVAA